MSHSLFYDFILPPQCIHRKVIDVIIKDLMNIIAVNEDITGRKKPKVA